MNSIIEAQREYHEQSDLLYNSLSALVYHFSDEIKNPIEFKFNAREFLIHYKGIKPTGSFFDFLESQIIEMVKPLNIVIRAINIAPTFEQSIITS